MLFTIAQNFYAADGITNVCEVMDATLINTDGSTQKMNRILWLDIVIILSIAYLYVDQICYLLIWLNLVLTLVI